MTQKLPRRYARIFHVPHGVAYMVENSRWGIALAVMLGFRWIDLDCHITKDGVPVIGHWGRIAKDHFILPDWFVRKYGHNPFISDVLWADLKQLCTRKISWRGASRRYHYITLERAATLVARHPRLGICLELKGDGIFNSPRGMLLISQALERAGLPADRVHIMRLSNIVHNPYKAFQYAHACGYKTIVLARGPIPISAEPHIDYVRGRWRRAA